MCRSRRRIGIFIVVDERDEKETKKETKKTKRSMRHERILF